MRRLTFWIVAYAVMAAVSIIAFVLGLRYGAIIVFIPPLIIFPLTLSAAFNRRNKDRWQ